jgi:hypothetical protein
MSNALTRIAPFALALLIGIYLYTQCHKPVAQTQTPQGPQSTLYVPPLRTA